jgi:HEAT repeat protein
MMSKMFVKLLMVTIFLVPVFLYFPDCYAFEETADSITAKLMSKDQRTKITIDENSLDILKKMVSNQDRDWHARIKAIRILGETADPSITDSLMFALYDPCPAIKWNAASALAKFHNDRRVIDVLIDALHSDDLYVKEAAIQSLGAIGNSKAVPFLIPELLSESFAIKFSAIKALGEIGGRGAFSYLVVIADRDSDALIRNEALKALGKIKSSLKAENRSAF